LFNVDPRPSNVFRPINGSTMATNVVLVVGVLVVIGFSIP